jgi:hypothetical protein
LTSTYVPPQAEVNVTLDTPCPLKSFVHRIGDFDNLFKGVLKSRGVLEDVSVSKKNRHVSFFPTAQVILIASRHEYHEEMLGDLLWWTRKELKSFQREARHEMRQLMRYAMYAKRFAPAARSINSPPVLHDSMARTPSTVSLEAECDDMDPVFTVAST